MKCKYCKNDSEQITGYWFSDGGSAEEEGDFICSGCMEKYVYRSQKKTGRGVNRYDVGYFMGFLAYAIILLVEMIYSQTFYSFIGVIIGIVIDFNSFKALGVKNE